MRKQNAELFNFSRVFARKLVHNFAHAQGAIIHLAPSNGLSENNKRTFSNQGLC